MKFIKYFREIGSKDISIAGGKGANLGELVKIRMPVPEGFVISSQAFEKFLKETSIDTEIQADLDRIDLENIESVRKNSKILKNLILGKKVPRDLAEEVFKSFDRLGTELVAVRSSAIAEDSKSNSWAGELETYLNTQKENLLENIKKCWASLFTPRAILYWFRKELNPNLIPLAVIVQKMVQSEVSGVCFTTHPVTKDKNQMVVEAVWGLGEALVSGKITPDNYVIRKSDYILLEKHVSIQEKMLKRGDHTNIWAKIPKARISNPKLSDQQIKKLAKICLKIEKHFGTPQDIEWAIKKGEIFTLQSRPITTL